MPTNVTYITTSQITHIGNGSSVAAGAMSASTDTSTALTTTNMNGWPFCDLQLTVSCSTSISSASNYIVVHRRDIDVDGTNDEPVPATATTTLWNKPVGVFPIQATSTSVASKTYNICDVPLPATGKCEFYLENKLNVAMAAGWLLKVIPKTYSLA
jgi:hypothetical protein